jgi:hypothetical protein
VNGISKYEIRNTKQMLMTENVDSECFDNLSFEIEICLGFRY